MALQMAMTSVRRPTHSLIPTGLPPASSRMRATNATSSRGVWKAECAAGLTQSRPCGTPRTAAISAVTLAAGSTPPIPGFAPWESLSDTHLTAAWAALSANRAGSNPPSGVRAPKYPLPSSHTRSPP